MEKAVVFLTHGVQKSFLLNMFQLECILLTNKSSLSSHVNKTNQFHVLLVSKSQTEDSNTPSSGIRMK